jgi:MFS family permease
MQPQSTSNLTLARAAPAALVTRDFALVLAIQASFGLSFSLFLLLPKFLAVRYGADADSIGWANAAPSLAAVVCVPVAGRLIDRWGKRPLILCGGLLGAAGSLGFLALTGVGPALFLLRALQGVGFVLLVNAGATLAADLAPAERLGEAIGLFGVAMLGTNAVGPVVAELVADRGGYGLVFVLSGVSALVATALSRLIEEPGRAAPPSRRPRRVRLPVLLASGASGLALGTMFTFTQPMALGWGIPRFKGFFVAYTLAAAFARLVLGSLADRVGRKRVSVASLGLYGLVVLATAWARPGFFEPLGLLFGLAHGLFYPAITALAVGGVRSAERGTAMSLCAGAGYAGTGLGVAALGYLARASGYPAVFLVTGAVTLAATALLALRGGDGQDYPAA